MSRRGFGLDLNLCTGCQACVVACTVENELPFGTSWRWVDTFNAGRLPGIGVHHLSLACNHCADAPCARACPAVAYRRDAETGAVLLDEASCIGCKYCTWACPYDAPKYDPAAGVVSKCTFCNERQLEGLAPACVSLCPTGALTLVPVDEVGNGAGPATASVPGFPRTAARPSIRFVPLREGVVVPRDGCGPPDPAGAPPPSKTSFRSEAPLWLFSLVVSLLAGVMATHAGREALEWPGFLGAAALAGLSSTLHLGRKARAWRAVLGWRTSWLSREILLFGAFVLAGTLELSGLLPGRVTGIGVGLLGLATLFTIDRVYSVTRTPGLALHSASSLSIGLLVAGLTADVEPLWVIVLASQLLLYGVRKHRLRRRGLPWRPVLSALRIGATLGGAALFAGGAPVAGAALLALGAGLDRAEFYVELEIPTPARQVREELEVARRALG